MLHFVTVAVNKKNEVQMKPKKILSMRQWRETVGLSQAELAKMVGCSRAAISLIENGLRVPRTDLLNRLYSVIPKGVVV